MTRSQEELHGTCSCGNCTISFITHTNPDTLDNTYTEVSRVSRLDIKFPEMMSKEDTVKGADFKCTICRKVFLVNITDGSQYVNVSVGKTQSAVQVKSNFFLATARRSLPEAGHRRTKADAMDYVKKEMTKAHTAEEKRFQTEMLDRIYQFTNALHKQLERDLQSLDLQFEKQLELVGGMVDRLDLQPRTPKRATPPFPTPPTSAVLSPENDLDMDTLWDDSSSSSDGDPATPPQPEARSQSRASPKSNRSRDSSRKSDGKEGRPEVLTSLDVLDEPVDSFPEELAMDGAEESGKWKLFGRRRKASTPTTSLGSVGSSANSSEGGSKPASTSHSRSKSAGSIGQWLRFGLSAKPKKERRANEEKRTSPAFTLPKPVSRPARLHRMARPEQVARSKPVNCGHLVASYHQNSGTALNNRALMYQRSRTAKIHKSEDDDAADMQSLVAEMRATYQNPHRLRKNVDPYLYGSYKPH